MAYPALSLPRLGAGAGHASGFNLYGAYGGGGGDGSGGTTGMDLDAAAAASAAAAVAAAAAAEEAAAVLLIECPRGCDVLINVGYGGRPAAIAKHLAVQ
jgi:hypothetical protein